MSAFPNKDVAAIRRRDCHHGGVIQSGVGGENQLAREIGRVAADEKGAIVAAGVQGPERPCHPRPEIAFALGEEGEAGEIFPEVSDIAAVKEQRLQGGEGGNGLPQGEVVNVGGFGKREGGTETGLDLARLRFLGKDAESAGPPCPQRG